MSFHLEWSEQLSEANYFLDPQPDHRGAGEVTGSESWPGVKKTHPGDVSFLTEGRKEAVSD